MSLFETATRTKMRFQSTKGALTVEDLWDLPLTSAKGVSLDGVAKLINREFKDEDEESFVNPASNSKRVLLQTKLDIVKRVIAVKQAENEEARNATEKRKQRELLLAARDAKVQQGINEMSLEDIDKQIAALG